ncbi:MAG TPA: hypothetical protein VIE46_02870, partial [Gemmatimonadales bacterium]
MTMATNAEPLIRHPAFAAPLESVGRPSMGLAQRLAILTAGLALLLVLGATEIALSWSARSRIEDFRDDAVSLANTISALLTNIAPTGDPDSLAEGLEGESLHRLGPTRHAWVYLAKGAALTLVASSDTDLVRAADDADALALARRTMLVRPIEGGRPGWQVATPLGNGTPYGVLDISVSTRRLEDWSRV